MNKPFWGIYASYIDQFITFKRGLGFKYKTEEIVLSIFDRFTIERGEVTVGITKSLADAWINLNPNESDSYKFHRTVCLNQLASFLCKTGIRSYIAKLPQCKNSFTPYIYSRDEVNVIFNACDSLRLLKGLSSIIIIIPALIRLLYATGLRISEALSLKNNDINLKDNYLIVKDSKNGKERMIPFSDSLSTVCKDYISQRNLIPAKITGTDPFFVSLQGKTCNSKVVGKWFKRALRIAGIPRNDHGPRLHDFRHTFSVHSLAQMAESGIDLYCALPVLSTYLGHQSLEATNQYVRLTAEMYPGLLKDADLVCLNVFPNIARHETN